MHSFVVVIVALLLVVLYVSAQANVKKTIIVQAKTIPADDELSVGAIVGIVIASVAVPLLLVAFLVCLVCYCGWCSFDLFRKKVITAETPYSTVTTIVDSQPTKLYY
jgi:hypothetical protein